MRERVAEQEPAAERGVVVREDDPRSAARLDADGEERDLRARVESRERLRDELWRDPALLRALGRDADPVEARALLREALRRRRPGLALRVLVRS